MRQEWYNMYIIKRTEQNDIESALIQEGACNMAHDFKFSLIGAHYSNAIEQIRNMDYVNNFDHSNLNYTIEDYDSFRKDICYGILGIYSMNALVESVVNYCIRELDYYDIIEFRQKVNKLCQQGIIENDENLDKYFELRKYRNIITHWERDSLKYDLGSMGYIRLMGSNYYANNNKERLVQILHKAEMINYFHSIMTIINNVIGSQYFSDDDLLKTYLEGEIEVDF